MADTRVGSIFFDLDAKTDNFKSGLSQAENQAKGAGGSISNAFKSAETGSFALLAGVTAAAVGFGVFAVASVGAFQDAERTSKQVDAALASTKGAAGVSKQAIDDLAASLMKETGVSDEAVRGSQAMLLTFTSVGKDIFPTAERAILDMATAMNGGLLPTEEELRTKTILVGKALQDPDAGLGALKRVGVNVDELRKKFTDAMPIQEKQKLILQELGTEFGGSAKAAGETLGGAIQKLKSYFDEFMEAVGSKLAPIISNIVKSFTNWFEKMGGAEAVLNAATKAVENMANWFPVLAGVILFGLIPAFAALGGSIWTALAPLLPFLAIGAAIGLIVKLLVDHFGGWQKTMEKLQPIINVIQNVLKSLWKVITEQIVPAIQKFIDIIKKIAESWISAVAPVFAQIIKTGKQIYEEFKKHPEIWQQMGKVLLIIAGVITGIIIVAFLAIAAAIVVVILIIAKIIEWFIKLINWNKEMGEKAGVAVKEIVKWFQHLWDRIKEFADKYLNEFVKFWTDTWNNIKNTASNIWDGIINKVGDAMLWVWNHISNIGNRIKDFWKNLWDGINNIAGSIWNNVVGGIKNGLNWLIRTLNDGINNINRMINDIPPIPGVGKVPNLPTIPELASGGIVTRPTLAIIGEAGPEKVVPLKDGDTGGTINLKIVTGPFLGSPQEFEKLGITVAKAIQRVQGSKGITQLEI